MSAKCKEQRDRILNYIENHLKRNLFLNSKQIIIIEK